MKTDFLLLLTHLCLLFPSLAAVKCYNGTYHRGVKVITCPTGCYEYREDRQGFGLIFWDLWYQKLGCREEGVDCNVNKREGIVRISSRCCRRDFCNPIAQE